MDDLITFLVDALRGGTIPRPAARENVDDYRFRVAHAGAMVALSWLQQVREQEEAEAARVAAAERRAADEAADGDTWVATGGATVTPLVTTAELEARDA